MRKYQKLLEEYYEAVLSCEDNTDDFPNIITKIYPKEILVKFNQEGFSYLQYYGYCGTNKGLKLIYFPCIDMEIDNFSCYKEALMPYDFIPDFDIDEEIDADGADPSSNTIAFMPDFVNESHSPCEITKWFYSFNFLTDKIYTSDDNRVLFVLMELTKDDIKELDLEVD